MKMQISNYYLIIIAEIFFSFSRSIFYLSYFLLYRPIWVVAKEKVWNAFPKFNQLLSLSVTESNWINRERHRYLCNEADNWQLFFYISPAISSSKIFQAIYYITYRLFQDGQDKYVKKKLKIGFTPSN